MMWMVSGPYVAEIFVSSNNDEEDIESKQYCHHEDIDSFEKRFRKDVIAFTEAKRN